MSASGPVEGADDAPHRPDPARSEARAYRRRRDRWRNPYRFTVGAVAILLFVNAIVFYVQNAPEGAGLTTVAGGSPSTSLQELSSYVSLGTPTLSNVTCGDGQSVVAESVPWVSSHAPLSPSQIFLVIMELTDGDIDGGSSGRISVSATSVCSNAPPTPAPIWYVVLQGPGGANLALYDYANGWAPIVAGTAPSTIAPGSSLVLVANPHLYGTAFGLCVLGDVDTPPFQVCAQL